MPTSVLYDLIFPHLDLSSFKNLLSCNKWLTRTFNVPLNDLNFKRFACHEHDLFLKYFVEPGGSGKAKPGAPINPDAIVDRRYCCEEGTPYYAKHYKRAAQAFTKYCQSCDDEDDYDDEDAWQAKHQEPFSDDEDDDVEDGWRTRHRLFSDAGGIYNPYGGAPMHPKDLKCCCFHGYPAGSCSGCSCICYYDYHAIPKDQQDWW